MSTDPVCGETIEVQRHTPKRLHQGVIYHFCSEECKESFKEEPGAYTSTTRRAGAY